MTPRRWRDTLAPAPQAPTLRFDRGAPTTRPTRPGSADRGRTERRRVTRFLALLLAFGAIALAIWALVVRKPEPPLDDIDAVSRAKLEQVLRQAEAEAQEGARP